MPVALKSTGGGSVTVQAANTASDYTATLPASTGTVVLSDTSGNSSITGNLTVGGTVVMGSSFLRNRLINGAMYVAQRAGSATVTAGTGVPTASTGYPCVDRWFVYSTGANVTAAQVNGTGSNKSLLQITGAASVTAVGIGQRIELINSFDLADKTCTLSVDIANSLLTTVTWTASYATTGDTFGTIGTPSKTQIATGTFTVNSTLTRYSTTISVPSAATTGIEILFTVGAQTSGTWQIGSVQFEEGSVATPFERRFWPQELALCQRYFQTQSSSDANVTGTTDQATAWYSYPVQMRVAPTMTFPYTNATYDSAGPSSGNWSFNRGYVTNISKTGTISGNTQIQNNWAKIYFSGMTLASNPTGINSNSQAQTTFSAEM